jgi:hypothetical protein
MMEAIVSRGSITGRNRQWLSPPLLRPRVLFMVGSPRSPPMAGHAQTTWSAHVSIGGLPRPSPPPAATLLTSLASAEQTPRVKLPLLRCTANRWLTLVVHRNGGGDIVISGSEDNAMSYSPRAKTQYLTNYVETRVPFHSEWNLSVRIIANHNFFCIIRVIVVLGKVPTHAIQRRETMHGPCFLQLV